MKKFAAHSGKRYLSLLLTLCILMGLATSLVVPGAAQEVEEPLVEHHHTEACEMHSLSESATPESPSEIPADVFFLEDYCVSESAETQFGSGLVGVGTYATTQRICFHSNSISSFAEAFNYFGPGGGAGGEGYGGHSSGSAVVGQYIGSNILPGAARAGYTFLGWYQGDACQNGTNGTTSFGAQYTANSIMPNQNLVLYARWQQMPVASPNSQLCFHGNGGYVKYDPNSSVVTGGHSGYEAVPHGARLGEHITWARSGYQDNSRRFPIAERAGYNFLGWYTSPQGDSMCPNFSSVVSAYGTEYTANSTMPARNLVLYARWERIVPNYSINYVSNFPAGTTGSPGSRTMNTPEYSILSYADVFGASYPSASGRSYSFRGWFDSATGGSQVTSVTANRTVYAQWNETITSYSIIFLANFPSGTGTSPTASETLASGASMPGYGGVFNTYPSATGKTYTFRGWYTAASGGTQVTSVTESLIVHAQWDEGVASYDVVYNANFPSGTGSQPTNKTEHQSYNASVKTYDELFGSKPTAAGKTYTFKGWFTAATGGSQVTTITAGQTVYAQWTEAYTSRTITYHANGGTGTPPDAQIGLSSASVNLSSPTLLSRSGHVFAGWLQAESAPSVIPADGSAPAGLMAAGTSYSSNRDVTLYAVWAVDSDTDGGGDYLQKKVVYKSGDLKSNLTFTVLLSNTATEFTTALCPADWNNNVLTKFDGWERNNGVVLSANKVVQWVADQAGGATMTLTAVAVSAGNKTVENLSVALTDATQQKYAIGDTLHGKGVTVTVTYRDGTTETLDTPAEISGAGITLKTVNGKNIGDALNLTDNGQALIASKGALTSTPSTGTIEVSDAKHTVTVIVIGGDVATEDIISVRDGSSTEIVHTNNRASGEGLDGETYTVWQSLSLPAKYQLQSFYINGEDHTGDFFDGNHSFVLTGNTTIYVVYNHDANALEYNLYANVISSAGTGYIGARRANRPTDTATYPGITVNNMLPTKIVAEDMDIDDEKVAVALLPNTGYRVGSVILNGDFITEGDPRWTTANGNVVIMLEADGNIKPGTTYFLLVNYVKDLGAGTTFKIDIKGETYHGGTLVTSDGTGNKVNISGQLPSEGGYTNLEYVAGSTILFGATAGDGYRLKNITLDGIEVAIGDLLYSLALVDLDADHEIVATFVQAQEGVEIIGGDTVVLRGAYAGESKAALTYYVRFNNAPLKAADLGKLTFEMEGNGMFASGHDMDDLARFTMSGSKVACSITGSEVIGGLTYATVEIEVTVRKSSTVQVKCGIEGTYIEGGHYDLVMPGDTNGDGRLSQTDVTFMQRIINFIITPEPGKGADNGYAFELCDMNLDGRIAIYDYTMVLRMMNGIVVPSN